VLFDLRGRGRRRTVQGIYLGLAVLMGGGLIFFGVGGTGIGLFNTGNGGGSNATISNTALKNAQRQVRRHPQDPQAWANLTRRRFQSADYNQNTQTYTNKAQLRQIGQAWDRYVALQKAKVDVNLATQMVEVFGVNGLNQPAAAVSALQIVTEQEPRNATGFLELATYAYLAGQTRKGDLAAQRAIALTPKASRPQVRTALKQAKQQAASRQLGGTSTTTTGG
jgi:hypothetical protein